MVSLHAIKQFILDILFPIHCLGCDQEGEWICDRCMKRIRLNARQACPVCRQPGMGDVCPGCRSKTALDGLLAVCDYDQPLVQACIHTLKYLAIPSLAPPIVVLMWRCLTQLSPLPKPSILSNKNTALTPVPLHARRLKNRGFNQSELIAKEIGRLAGLPSVELLVRTCYTESQMSLTRAERLKNVLGAFSIKSDFEKMPENVIIIDDVATTLATLHECASVLKSHGAKTVWGLVVARGSS
ncbi:MAG: ComF family protein [Patescibacteria group bacterium]